MSGQATNRTDRALYWIKNNRLLAVILILGVIVVGVGQFTDAVMKIDSLVKGLRLPIRPRDYNAGAFEIVKKDTARERFVLRADW